ncbi:MAG: hypothetical protein WEE89_13910 [Gemmatimonadota bacterium]
MSILNQLKRRKLIQWGIGYLAGAWVLLQVVDVIGDQFNWPVTLFRAVAVVLAVGFRGALVLAWFHGERGRQRIHEGEVILLGALVIIAGAGHGARGFGDHGLARS